MGILNRLGAPKPSCSLAGSIWASTRGSNRPTGAYSALCGKADVAVQGAFCDRIEEFVDEEDGVEVIWPGEK